MGNRLFVGGLSWNTDDHGLRSAFERFGEVTDSKVITDRETGKSRGFGFVTYSTEDAARAAMEQLNDTALDGRNITVNEAQERQPRSGGGGGRSYGGGGGGGRSYSAVSSAPAPEVERRGGRSKGRGRRGGGGDFGDDRW